MRGMMMRRRRRGRMKNRGGVRVGMKRPEEKEVLG